MGTKNYAIFLGLNHRWVELEGLTALQAAKKFNWYKKLFKIPMTLRYVGA